ncbi:hypothetical protein [uncultured Roseovarius sp.]|uniref:hypothetical protein n=1 Tax=uncultured Roseovarius sp. TaxID=293344 RepID=UPI002632616A|nr:hypothetical protein [uncultured Roseovarius sp.]
MANYEWIIHVIDDLESFSENENLENLRQWLKQARTAVKLDIQSLDGLVSISQEPNRSEKAR